MNKQKLREKFSFYEIDFTTKAVDELICNCKREALVLRKEKITTRNITNIAIQRLIDPSNKEEPVIVYVGFDYKIKDKQYDFLQDIKSLNGDN